LAQRIRHTPAIHLADQALSSGTNMLAVVVVARNGTPEQFGVFSIFLITYYFTVGFNRFVPHAIAMSLHWDDERARSSYFFLPPLVVGAVATVVLVPIFASIDRSFLLLPILLLPMLLQDAVRMHAFAIQKPQLALLSDGVWMVALVVGFLFVSTAASAASVWAIGGLCGLLISRPWSIRMRLHRRPIGASLGSAALEYITLMGLAYATPLLAAPIITVLGVAALQGAGLIRGPITLLVQGLMLHRMSGPPIGPGTCIRAALQLSATTLGVTLMCIPPLILLKDVYGPYLLGATWPSVEPLVLPALLTLVVGSVSFGPATIVRKMGRFNLSAKVQVALAPLLVGFPLAGAGVAGPKGFLYATALAYVVFGVTWWSVLKRVAGGPALPADVSVA
jgi:hypothetical protein